jgi:ATP-dependent Clp protease ATP-binding subunit ClpA
MRIADELRIALTRAVDDAQKRRHEYLTLEHVLLALLHDPDTAKMMRSCGAKLRQIEQELTVYLDTEVESLPEHITREPIQTDAFVSIFHRARMQAISSGKEILTGPMVLIELMRLDDSFAVYLLKSQGIKRVDFTGYLSHGARKTDKKNRENADENNLDDEFFEGDDDPLQEYATELVQ